MPDLTVFISYRRADSSADAGRLYDALRRRFGRENLFMDVDSLRPGEDWVVAVEAAVGRCDVLLAIIGPDWVTVADSEGNRRLHKELDRVRLEIEAALRNSKPVIPVLVEGASMPSSEDLPETLRPLLRRHAIRVSHSTFESDLGALVRALRIIDRATHGRATTRRADEAETAPLVVTPAPEPALPAPPPTTAPTATPLTTTPPPPPGPPPAPVLTQPYVAQPTPPMPVPQPAYVPPAVTPAYPYAQPPYSYAPPYAPPARRSGPSGVLLGAMALGLVLILGVGAMYALHLGPFANTAQASPTPSPTAFPTLPPATASPLPPPTPSSTPSSTPFPTSSPTLIPSVSAPPPSASLSPEFARLLALVPIALRDMCDEAEFEAPTLNCYVDELGTSFFYSSSADLATLRLDYSGWLSYWDVAEGVANCFDKPIPVPCEGAYDLPDIVGAGRVTVLPDGASAGRMYWTHEPALILGEAYILEINDQISFQDVFDYWANNASVLNYTP